MALAAASLTCLGQTRVGDKITSGPPIPPLCTFDGILIPLRQQSFALVVKQTKQCEAEMWRGLEVRGLGGDGGGGVATSPFSKINLQPARSLAQ